MRGVELSDTEVNHGTGQVAEVINPRGGGAFVLVCEHASNRIPTALNGLGLDDDTRHSHIAWDPGAKALAAHMSETLSSPLVSSLISRLVYDCNREPGHPSAVLARSELHDVPGNANLSETDRAARERDYYSPFSSVVAETIQAAPSDAALITVHSFTPVYFGKTRDVEIGILHDTDSRLADLMLDSGRQHTQHVIRRNEPYSPKDGVTHTLKLHGIRNGLANVMLEIRSDLIATADTQRAMADMLSGWLTECLVQLNTGAEVA